MFPHYLEYPAPCTGRSLFFSDAYVYLLTVCLFNITDAVVSEWVSLPLEAALRHHEEQVLIDTRDRSRKYDERYGFNVGKFRH